MSETDVAKPLGSSETPPDDYDSPWKEVSGRFFPDLVKFFAHDLHADTPDVRLPEGEAVGV